jgi:hypothetical protein
VVKVARLQQPSAPLPQHELIDAYADGRLIDPYAKNGGLRKLPPQYLALYRQAKAQGFVEAYPKPHPHTRHYYHWCHATNVPFVKVGKREVYWSVVYDADYTCGNGGEYTFNPGPEFVEKFKNLVKERLSDGRRERRASATCKGSTGGCDQAEV